MHISSYFLPFPLKVFVSFIFIDLFLNLHLALVLFSSLYFNWFFSGTYNFWFPLFAGSIYCTLFLLECFDFAYGCICICIYSVTLSVVVINLCLYIGLLQFWGVSFFFLSLFLILTFNFLNLLYFFHIFSFICLYYYSFPLAVNR